MQSFVYTVSAIVFLVIGFISRLRPKNDKTGLCLIESRDSNGIAIFVTCLVLLMMLISALILVGV